MKKLILLTISAFTIVVAAQTVDRRAFDPVPDKVVGAINGSAPSDAIVLFDGSNMDAWITAETEEAARWEIDGDAMTVRRGMSTIKTKQAFGDIQLHLEFRPTAVIEGEGQSRGNSGVFLHSLFEVQILDSWENPTYVNGQAGSVYLQYPPLVNAAQEPGEWQSYDIIFKAPVYDGRGNLSEPAYLTVLHNGVLVQNHVELKGATYTPMPEYGMRCVPYSQEREQDCSGKMPITLQDHGQVVSYRNIWVREL
ncbi:MAG: DUF1080 domain-containing protein [Pseudomonadales bacterium]|nr:DUF1080 domain-containing protein [Pseudomonadales bacterium]